MLTIEQKRDLQKAIENYNFPTVAFDFKLNKELQFDNMHDLEKHVLNLLLNPDITAIKDGLSNVLYLGYATSGYRDYRVKLFRKNVTDHQLRVVGKLFQRTLQPSITEIKELRMPQFSGISFISKIRMFLDPESSAVLDKQIIKIKFSTHGKQTVLAKISYTLKESQLRPSKPNSNAYEAWCQRLLEISTRNFDSKYRAVDIERGLFALIRNGKLNYAAKILANA